MQEDCTPFLWLENIIFCLFIQNSAFLPLGLHMLSYIRTMSSYNIKRMWGWKETTELRKSNQKVMYICLCVSLWSRELQATLAWITHTAVSRGHNTGVTWQKTVCMTLLLYMYFTTFALKFCWNVAFVTTLRNRNSSIRKQIKAKLGSVM